MGTWSQPDTVKKAKELQELMQMPLPAKTAQTKLYNLLGDDLLFDYIDECNPKADVRPLVKMRLCHFLETLDSFFKEWEDEAIYICNRII